MVQRLNSDVMLDVPYVLAPATGRQPLSSAAATRTCSLASSFHSLITQHHRIDSNRIPRGKCTITNRNYIIMIGKTSQQKREV